MHINHYFYFYSARASVSDASDEVSSRLLLILIHLLFFGCWLLLHDPSLVVALHFFEFNLVAKKCSKYMICFILILSQRIVLTNSERWAIVLSSHNLFYHHLFRYLCPADRETFLKRTKRIYEKYIHHHTSNLDPTKSHHCKYVTHLFIINTSFTLFYGFTAE
jgi:hypothetical protein